MKQCACIRPGLHAIYSAMKTATLSNMFQEIKCVSILMFSGHQFTKKIKDVWCGTLTC